MATIDDISSIERSGVTAIDALLGSGPAWNYETTGAGNVLYYTFSGMIATSAGVASISLFNAGQIAATRQVLGYIETVTGIDFVETTDVLSADVLFASANILESDVIGLAYWETAYSYMGGGVVTWCDATACVYLDVYDEASNLSPAAGTAGYQVLLHEIGHVLGLKHPFDGSPVLAEAADDTDHTVMSYTWVGDNKTVYQEYDLDALWWIYGGDGLGGTYGINSALGPTLPGETPSNPSTPSTPSTPSVPSTPSDTIAPTVVTFVPADAATGVDPGADIVLTFSEAIARGTGNIVLVTDAGMVAASFDAATSSRLTIAGNTLTIDPVADLDWDAHYMVMLEAGSVTDLAGNAYAGTVSYDFTTAPLPDAEAPAVLAFWPADASAGALPDSNIVITMSEAITRGTGWVVIRDGDGVTVASYDAATSSRLAISGNTLTINPLADLEWGTDYTVVLAAGCVRDLAGNAFAGTADYGFSTLANPALGSAGGTAVLAGSGQADRLVGQGLDELIVGGGGNDVIDGGAGSDTVLFVSSLADSSVARSGNAIVVTTSARADGTDSLTNVERLRFSDLTVDLTIGETAAGIDASALKTLEELYVGFFNRVPEASGLAYWIDQVAAGASLQSVADQFYDAGVQFGLYSPTLSEAQFITTIYANVLGRTGASAPDSSEIGYWQNWLHTGENTKGGMVLQMLSDSHEHFTDDPVVGWVIDLLNNKAAVADYFAVELGLSYLTQEESIARGIEIAAAITPTDTAAAISLIGVDGNLVLA